MLPLPSRATLTGAESSASSILARFQAPGVTVVARVPSAGPGATTDQGGDARADGLLDDAGADEMDVAVDRPGGEDLAVARQDLRRRSDHELRVHPVGDVRVPRLAQRHDAAVSHADVGLDHSPVVEDDGSGDHQIGRALRSRRHRLAHGLADRLATAEHRLVSRARSVLGHLDHRSVSASRRRSPTVGPYRETYGPRSIFRGDGTGRVQGPPARPRKPETARARRGGPASRACDPGLEADGGAGGDGQPASPGGVPVEGRGPVGLGEMEVRADLDRPVARVETSMTTPAGRPTGRPPRFAGHHRGLDGVTASPVASRDRARAR